MLNSSVGVACAARNARSMCMPVGLGFAAKAVRFAQDVELVLLSPALPTQSPMA